MLASAAFGTSGSLAKGLLTSGWSAAAVVTWRVAVGAVALAIPAVVMMRGRWGPLRRGWPSILLFGVVAVAGCQLAFFMAVERLEVAVALLLEFLGIVLIVGWLWLRHGQRPRWPTVLGAALSIAGLVFMLDLFGGVTIDLVGVLWGLLAGVGLAVYFVVSADDSHGVPGVVVASGGLGIGAVILLLAGSAGLLPLRWGTQDVLLAGSAVPWWLAVAAIGLIASTFAYGVGVLAARRLGSKLASFVSLSEVMFAVGWAWLLLGELPAPVQLLGGVLILAGVLVVRLDERPRVDRAVSSEAGAVAGERP